MGIFFIADTLQMWHAMLLLVIHGCAGVLWQTPNQLLLYDIVGPADLPSAVRLNATCALSGHPGQSGRGRRHHADARPIPRHHFQHAVLSADAALAVLGAHPGQGRRTPAHPVRGLADIVQTIRDIATQRVLTSMTLLAGLHLLHDRQRLPRPDAGLCRRSPGTATPACPTACCWRLMPPARCSRASPWKRGDGSNRLRGQPSCSPSLWSLSLLAFASVSIYALAIALLFAAGFFELSFNTMAQALVQINAPADIRGRVVGLFNMARPRHAGLQRHHRGPRRARRSAFTGRSACRPPCCWCFCLSCIAGAASSGKSPSQVSESGLKDQLGGGRAHKEEPHLSAGGLLSIHSPVPANGPDQGTCP